MSNTYMDEKSILEDILISQKYIAHLYNMCVSESISPSIRNAFMDILSMDHDIEAECLEQLKKRGWHTV